jgi:predicted dehydrogenase
LSGKHVLVEKPLTRTRAQAEELVSLADEHGLTLMTGHTFQYHPAVVRARELIEAGELGEVRYIESSRVNHLGLHQFDVNVLWDLGPHDLSIVLYWLDAEPVSVTAAGAAYVQPGIEDVVFLTLEFPGRVLAHVQMSWEKMIVFDEMENVEKLKLYDRGVIKVANGKNDGDLRRDYRSGDIISPHVDFTEPLRLECMDFVQAIRTGKTPRADGRAGLRVVKVLEAAQRSLEEGGRAQPVLTPLDIQAPHSAPAPVHQAVAEPAPAFMSRSAQWQ